MATRLNPDKMTKAEQMKLAVANQRIAAQQSADYARTAAAPIQALGQAAEAGGMFVDTSAAPGAQNPFAAQQTKQYMGQITRPSIAALKGAKRFQKRMNMPYWERLMQSLGKGTNAATGTASGVTTTSPSTTYNQDIL